MIQWTVVLYEKAIFLSVIDEYIFKNFPELLNDW